MNNSQFINHNLSENHFAIVADDTRQIEFVIAVIIQKLMQTQVDKLVFIDYANNSNLLNNLSVRLKELWSEKTYCPNEILIPELKSKSVVDVKLLIDGLSSNDVVILFNLTNILSAQTQNGVSMVKGGLSIQIGSFCNLNWDEFREKVLSIRSSTNSNIFFHISIDKDCQDILKSTFIDDEVDIYYLSNDEGEKVTTQEMINDIRCLPYNEVYTKIESLKSKLDLNSYLSLRVMLYMHYYRHGEAINLLDENYLNLNNDLKKLLADLHSSSEGGEARAFEILAELHDKLPNTYGLYESISRVILNNDPQNGQSWMNICLNRDPDNVKILDCAANFYNRRKQYADAEELRHKLFRITNDPRHLLIAEILAILKNDKIDKHEAEKKIEAFADKHKDNIALCDECYYRLGLLWSQKYNSSYKAFYSLSKVSVSIDNEFAGKVARLKLDTLIDLVAKGKAQYAKPAKYADLPSFLSDMLVSSIPALTFEKDGFWIWRNFLEKVQDFSTWEKSLVKISLSLFSKGKTQSIRHLSEKSYYLSNPQITNDKSSIFIARFIRSGIPSEDLWDQAQKTINDMMDSPEGLIANAQSPIEDCFVRYQLAIIASDRGKTQLAQNQALHLWMVADQSTEASLSKKARLLGIIAWGYARLRSGDIIEGVCCLLSSVQLAIECEEVGPLLEDGYRTLRYWALNRNVFTEEEKKSLVENLQNPFEPEYRAHVYFLLSQQKWEELYTFLSKYMVMDRCDTEWALDLFNYIQAAFHSGHRKEVVELIDNNYKKFVRTLEGRKDIRPTILSVMADMVLLEKRLDLAKLLLDQAVNDMEFHRSQFFHKEERATFLDINRTIYSDHAVITVALFSELSLPPIELLNAMNRVTVRSLVENRSSMEPPSAELSEIEKQYRELLEDYTRASASGVPLQSMDHDEVVHFKKIQDTLIKSHPFYRSLPLIDFLSEKQLQENICEDEILYQVVIGKMWSASMIVTTDEIFFNIAFINRQEILKHVQIISNYMLSLPEYNTLPTKEVDNSIEILSKSLFGTLINFISKSKKRRIFLCNDVALGMFSSSLIKVDGNWLFERVDSIKNIVSPVELMQKTMANEPKYKVNLFLFGSNTDRAISKIASWQQRSNISQVVTLNSLDIQKTKEEIKRLGAMSPYIAFIAGHGVHDSNRQSGAIFISGKKELISAQDLSPILKTCESAIVLSCSGGIPVTIQPERGEGIWAGIIGMGVKSALLCTWDVDAEATLGIIDYLLQHEHSKFPSLLCDVKRGMIRNKKYSNPYFWAGVEYWGAG